MIRSKKGIESVVNQAVAKFFTEQIGERPEVVTTQVVKDIIIVTLKGVLPPAERHLARDKDGGGKLMEVLKVKLIERAKPLLEVIIINLTGVEVVDILSSFNVETGEHIEIFKLNKDLEKIQQA